MTQLQLHLPAVVGLWIVVCGASLVAAIEIVVLANRLFELRPELGGSASSGAVGKVEDCSGELGSRSFRQWGTGRPTLLNAVLLGGTLRGAGDALNTLVVMVLGGSALLGIPALYSKSRSVSSASDR